jgi:hypothetical protein
MTKQGLSLVLLGLILRGLLNKEKALLPLGRELRALLFSSLQKASFLRSENNKALMLRIKAFSL